MKTFKNLVCTFGLIACMCLTFAGKVEAKQVYTEGFFKYEIEDEAVRITEYFGTAENVKVPSAIAGYPVSVIASGAFSGDTAVKTLSLPDTIMEIEAGAIADGITVDYAAKSDAGGNASGTGNGDASEQVKPGKTAKPETKPETKPGTEQGAEPAKNQNDPAKDSGSKPVNNAGNSKVDGTSEGEFAVEEVEIESGEAEMGSEAAEIEQLDSKLISEEKTGEEKSDAGETEAEETEEETKSSSLPGLLVKIGITILVVIAVVIGVRKISQK